MGTERRPRDWALQPLTFKECWDQACLWKVKRQQEELGIPEEELSQREELLYVCLLYSNLSCSSGYRKGLTWQVRLPKPCTFLRKMWPLTSSRDRSSELLGYPCLMRVSLPGLPGVRFIHMNDGIYGGGLVHRVPV